MAFATKTQLPTFLNCGGRQRLYIRGTGVVSGVIQIEGVPSPGCVYLHEAGGALRGYRETGNNGAYTFLGLAPGSYRLVIEDLGKRQRLPKVELIEVT